MIESIPHEENEEIRVFDLEFVHIQIELNKTSDETDVTDAQYQECNYV